ncbi:MAG: type II toxin-antitoxin system RelE/ParE family toxin [Myxococcales bacterium]|nr:type II toxin-antitoxin system RelE/ParE family toxin [Myxococcales bacterium]
MRYEVFLEPEVHHSRARLPGHVRQRIRQVLESFQREPRPPKSAPLDVSGLPIPPTVEVRRCRVESWRIVYAVNDQAEWVWVLAVRRRPPYDYTDLVELLERLGDDPAE